MMVDQPAERSMALRPGLIAAAIFLSVYGTLALAVDFPRAAVGFKSDEATYYMMAYSLIDDVGSWNAERRKRGERFHDGIASAWARWNAARHARSVQQG